MSVPQIFNKLSKIAQKTRIATNPISSQSDYLKFEVAGRIVDRMLDINRQFETVLDIGSGPGHIYKQVDTDMITKKLYQLDNSKPLLFRDCEQDCKIENRVETERIVGDLESLPFEDDKFDLICSNLSLHWCNDLVGNLIQIKNKLVPDGVFIGTLFTTDTLFELRFWLSLIFRTVMQLCDIERKGGISPHISPMVQHQQVGSLLQRAGFNLVTVDVDEIVVNYPSMFELMEDLRGMGESNCMNDRAFTSKEYLMSCAAAYKELYGKEDFIPATFQMVYVIGWKPDASQPKALERGTATKSFKELDNLLVDKFILKKE